VSRPPPSKGSFDLFLCKLLSHSGLSPADRAALLALPRAHRRFEPGAFLLREGDRPDICPILLSGFAFRRKLSQDGDRQIVAIKIPGDSLDFQSIFVSTADHDLQALTEIEVAVIANRDMENLVASRPGIARAVITDILIEASVGREWLLNNGRRSARARLAHLLCELHLRLELTGSPGLVARSLPLTQEQLADLLGLTPVHINRTLKTLVERGAVVRSGRKIRIADLEKLKAIAGFNPRYLHREVDAACGGETSPFAGAD